MCEKQLRGGSFRDGLVVVEAAERGDLSLKHEKRNIK